MYTEQQQTALSALEAVLRGMLDCEKHDKVDIVSEPDGNWIKVLGFTVSRTDLETATVSTAKFVRSIGHMIEADGKMYPIGDYFIDAANLFLREVLDPYLRGVNSVGKMMASNKSIDLEKRLQDAKCHDIAETRLYPNSLRSEN
jgi:hypothetical protein